MDNYGQPDWPGQQRPAAPFPVPAGPPPAPVAGQHPWDASLAPPPQPSWNQPVARPASAPGPMPQAPGLPAPPLAPGLPAPPLAPGLPAAPVAPPADTLGEGSPPGWSGALRSPGRFVAAALLLVVLAAHALVTEDQFERAGYLGALFVLIEVGSVVGAALLSWRDNRLAWLLAGLVTEVGVVAFVVTRTVRLPQVTDDMGSWTDPLAVLAFVVELAVIGLAGWAISRRRPASSATATRMPLISGLLALQVGAVATFAVASLPVSATPAAASGGSSVAPGSGYWTTVAGAAMPAGTTRTYYIASDEVVWDYAPTGRNQITGAPFDETAQTYVKNGPNRIGSKYVKCLYRGYADQTFTKLTQRPASDAYLGLFGPVIRAAVGDTIKVVFHNTCSLRTSVHPHGVFYQKNSEGAPYADSTGASDKLDDGVPKGGTVTYTWRVPERAGPAGHDGSSVMWMYHSHTDEVGDTYAGLMGPMVVTAAAQARPDGSPKDVDREIFILYSVMNENSSPYLKTNVQRFTKLAEPPGDDDEEFNESNLMHSINGYVFGNQPMITIKKGQRVRWYVMDMGTEVDLHTPHWHGNDVVVSGMRMDVINLLPASMVVADMVPDNVGTWLFHCHVNDHLTAGMITRFQVT